MNERRRLPGPLTRFARQRSTTIVVAGIAIVLVVLSLFYDNEQAETETAIVATERDATAEQAVAASDPVLDLCDDATPVGEALRADPGNPCGLARQVVNDPVPAVTAVEGPRGPGPSVAEVRAAVAEYLRANPPPAGQPPSPADVAAAVAGYLTANPPTPGRPPSADEIQSAVQTYFATNPPPSGEPGDDGQPGDPGEPGRPPTAAEIAAAVDDYLALNPPPAGDPGDSGDQGVGVMAVRAEIRGDMCALVFVLLDPADGSMSEQVVPVSARVCDDGGLLG